MRVVIGMVALVLVCWAASGARAAPVPKEVQGRWSEDPSCKPGAMLVTFTATTLETCVNGRSEGRAQITATGQARTRLQLQITKVLASAEGSAPPSVGDAFVVRLERNKQPGR